MVRVEQRRKAPFPTARRGKGPRPGMTDGAGHRLWRLAWVHPRASNALRKGLVQPYRLGIAPSASLRLLCRSSHSTVLPSVIQSSMPPAVLNPTGHHCYAARARPINRSANSGGVAFFCLRLHDLRSSGNAASAGHNFGAGGAALPAYSSQVVLRVLWP